MGIFYCLLTFVLLAHAEDISSTILERIINSDEYSTFNHLLQKTNYANLAIFTTNVTVFVPDDEAFSKCDGKLSHQILYSHVVFEAKTLNSLQDGERLLTSRRSPPLWVTKNSGGVFVNNARILTEESDYVVKTKRNGIEQIQVSHKETLSYLCLLFVFLGSHKKQMVVRWFIFVLNFY